MSQTAIPQTVKYFLWGKSAGRCQYRGCNIGSKSIQPHFDNDIFDLDSISDAFQKMKQKKHQGKILIKVD